MAVHNAEFEARAARFRRAHGHCECHGVGCPVATHVREISTDGRSIKELGCKTRTAPDGPDAANTVIIVMHPYDDPMDDDNLRVYCQPCADFHERAVASAQAALTLGRPRK